VLIRSKTYSKYTESDDILFSHFKINDVITRTILYDYYNKLLKDVKVKYNGFEAQYLCSLRHFFITLYLVATHPNQSCMELRPCLN